MEGFKGVKTWKVMELVALLSSRSHLDHGTDKNRGSVVAGSGMTLKQKNQYSVEISLILSTLKAAVNVMGVL